MLNKLLFAIATIVYLSQSELTLATPLDDYVKAPDPYYSYEFLNYYTYEGYRLYVLNMTSQKWLDGKHTYFII